MQNECLLELYTRLTPEAKAVFEVLAQRGQATMEKIMLTAHITNQQVRRGVWGLACTGLIVYERGKPVRIPGDGQRLSKLLDIEEGN